MTVFILVFIAGLFVGSTGATVIISMCMIARDADDRALGPHHEEHA